MPRSPSRESSGGSAVPGEESKEGEGEQPISEGGAPPEDGEAEGPKDGREPAETTEGDQTAGDEEGQNRNGKGDPVGRGPDYGRHSEAVAKTRALLLERKRRREEAENPPA
eukprot:RCo035827